MRSEHVSDTVNRIYLENGDEIILVGTAHVSQNSVDEVRAVIEQENPDHICLELDKGRYESKTKEQSYSNMNLTKVFREGKTFLVLANTALASFQKKMGNQTGSPRKRESPIPSATAKSRPRSSAPGPRAISGTRPSS